MTDEAAGETPEQHPVQIRNALGQLVKGTPAHPKAGRPPSLKDGKHKLTHLKQKLDIAVREHLDPAKIKKILDKMCDMAADGNVRAAKLILDKVVSNADNVSVDEADGQESKRVVFVIENATFAAVKAVAPPEAIDVEVIPVTPPEESNQ